MVRILRVMHIQQTDVKIGDIIGGRDMAAGARLEKIKLGGGQASDGSGPDLREFVIAEVREGPGDWGPFISRILRRPPSYLDLLVLAIRPDSIVVGYDSYGAYGGVAILEIPHCDTNEQAPNLGCLSCGQGSSVVCRRCMEAISYRKDPLEVTRPLAAHPTLDNRNLGEMPEIPAVPQ